MDTSIRKKIRVISFEKRQEYGIKNTDVFRAFVFMEKELACFYILQNNAMFFITLNKDEFEIV